MPHTRRPHAAATVAITAGRPDAVPDGPLNPAVVFASTYHAGGPVAYGRDGNPTWDAFETALGALEGGEALAFASGMAAVAAVLESLPVGAPVVVPRDGYTGTRALIEDAAEGRWEMRGVDIVDTAATLDACHGAALLWIESPTNPKMDIADIPALAEGARERGALVAVDNTYATPLVQRPLRLGADMVVHSVTKLLSGHSDVVMGAVVARAAHVRTLRMQRSLHGAVPAPMETYLALRGLRTLPVRLDRAQANAAELARRLARHPAVERVRYPGLPDDPGYERARAQMSSGGSMLAFDVRGGADAAEAVARSTRLIVHATSLGGIETTMERRRRWAREELTPPQLLRLSVGCEDVDDLWDDLTHALRIGCGDARAESG
ncbi:MAG: aminotransferase class I/II-fold pyridoxal phosphate-dependent enzyme [Actinobacteria bacterium]|nr:aminotransferase class I/II-fold pyridoxal phosphate-dependent enzyme [Actinomycetota bacterium]